MDIREKRQREKLAAELLPIASKQARLLSEQTRQPFEELFSIGQLAIAEAMRKADINRPGFFRYVKVYICGYMYNFLRDSSRMVRVPRPLTNIYLKERSLKRLMSDYEQLTTEEQAVVLGVAVGKLLESRSAINLFFDSLDGEGFDQFSSPEPLEVEQLSLSQEVLAKVLYYGAKLVADELSLPIDEIIALSRQGITELTHE